MEPIHTGENFVEREARELQELAEKWKQNGISSMEHVEVIFTVGPPPEKTTRVRVKE